MKKVSNLTKLFLGLPAMFSVMFFVACSNDDKDYDNVSSRWFSDPEISAIIAALPNTAVTQNNFNDFISELDEEFGFWFIAVSQNTRSLPDEYGNGKSETNVSKRTFGKFSGRTEIFREGGWAFDSRTNTESNCGIREVKIFDFSNSGTLFLGGSYEVLETLGEDHYVKPATPQTIIYNMEHYNTKFNGRLEFRGNFKGTIVFDNVVLSVKMWREDLYKENIEVKITSGSFFVESGATTMNLPTEILRKFSVGFVGSSYDYDNTPDAPTMHTVPTAPNGRLTARTDAENAVVNAENINNFLDMFFEELSAGSSFTGGGVVPRSTDSQSEQLRHGNESGYFLEKLNRKHWNNNSVHLNGVYWYHSRTVEYSDYSNFSKLYFGGGFGKANTGIMENGASTDEHKLNGRINFNGKFFGTLEFQNFHYKTEWVGVETIYTHISGKVMIGSLDVTNDYLELLKRW